METLYAKFDDDKTWNLLNTQRTAGVFQVEGHGLTDFLLKLQANSFDTLIDVVSIYRPGPCDAGMVKTYVDRFTGKEKISYDHPLLEPILRHTYGIIIFQEQCQMIAHKLAGYTLPESDLFRKAISSKKEEMLKKERTKFVDGCVEHSNIQKKLADDIFNKIVTFAGYGFNKSHGVAYALITFWTAYLKANYTLEYMTSLLGSQTKEDDIRKYIREAKTLGIKIGPPNIGSSLSSFSIHETEENTIVFGLSKIKGIGKDVAHHVIKNRPYKDFLDFVVKLINAKTEDNKTIMDTGLMETFIKAGCFRQTKSQYTTKQLLENLEMIVSIFKSKKNISPHRVACKSLEIWEKQKRKNNEPLEYSQLELASMERETIGFYITTHPLCHLKHPDALNSDKYVDMSVVKDSAKDVMHKDFFSVGALTDKVRTKKSRRGIVFYELELEDEQTSVKLPIFGNKHTEVLNTLKPGDVIAIKMQKSKNKFYINKIKKVDLEEISPACR